MVRPSRRSCLQSSLSGMVTGVMTVSPCLGFGLQSADAGVGDIQDQADAIQAEEVEDQASDDAEVDDECGYGHGSNPAALALARSALISSRVAVPGSRARSLTWSSAATSSRIRASCFPNCVRYMSRLLMWTCSKCCRRST